MKGPCISRYVSCLLFVCFFMLPVMQLLAQTISGRIVDERDEKPVSFAAVILDHSNTGTTADLDGHFTLRLPEGAQYLSIQMIGYVTKTVSITGLQSKNNSIYLSPNGIRLSEIEIKPGVNPALAIISKVIENKPTFDIANLPWYFCSTYSKTYFTLSGQQGDENFYNADTKRFVNTKKLLDKTYLLFIESVTEKKYRYRNISQEKVIASKTSGFTAGAFGSFASQLQSFTFYEDNISLLGLNYLSPLAKSGFKRYNFEITDTILDQNDTTLLIKFYPKKKLVFESMKGLLYINKNQYVLANVLAEPNEITADGHGIKIQQLYSRIDSSHWFPKQLNTEILFDTQAKGVIKQMIKAVSRQYISDVRLDSMIEIKDKNVVLYESENTSKDELFWKNRRNDSLTAKETETYHFIDSLSKKENLEKKMRVINALAKGKIPLGYVDADLEHLIRVNDYEGLRAGLGLSSSDKLSRWFSLGGYAGYGFHDKAWKYGGNLQLNFNRRKSTYINMEAAKEVTETAGVNFLTQNNPLTDQSSFRDLLINKMDKVNFGRLSFTTSLHRFIKLAAFLDVRQQTSPFGYLAGDLLSPKEQTLFTVNTTGVRLRIWPGEKFSESMGNLISMGSKWPVFYVNVTKGLTTKIDRYTGDFDFTKIDLRVDHKINFKVKGFFAYELQAGKVFGNVPYSLQYNNKGSRTNDYELSVERTMETIYLNQFTSTQYAAVFLALNIGQLIRPRQHTRPELELVHNYIIGSLANKNRLAANVPVADLSKGYSEAGIRLKNVFVATFSGFGAGFFYRYGNYASRNASSNLVIKLTYSLVF